MGAIKKMSPSFIYTNSKGQSVEFKNSAPIFLRTYSGTGGSSVDIQTQKSPYQDGETITNTTLEMRDIHLDVVLLGPEVVQYRRLLSQVLNPKMGPGKLVFRLAGETYEIETIPNSAPIFPGGKARMPNYQECLIELLAPNPFWKDISEDKTDISTEEGNFEFPLEIPPEGLELSIRTISFITNIYNPGDVDTPIRVRLRATGTVINPIIENLDTGEFIRVKRTLLEGDALEINTAFGNKRVEIIKPDGTRENVFHYIDYKSTFFQLASGDNTIKYDADVGENNLDVSIYYTPQYLGV